MYRILERQELCGDRRPRLSGELRRSQERSLEGRLASHFHLSPWVVLVPLHPQHIHRTANRSTITNSIPASLVTPLPHQNSTFAG